MSITLTVSTMVVEPDGVDERRISEALDRITAVVTGLASRCDAGYIRVRQALSVTAQLRQG